MKQNKNNCFIIIILFFAFLLFFSNVNANENAIANVNAIANPNAITIANANADANARRAYNTLLRAKLCMLCYDNANDLMKNGILLGCHQGLVEEQFNHIEEVSKEFFDQFN